SIARAIHCSAFQQGMITATEGADPRPTTFDKTSADDFKASRAGTPSKAALPTKPERCFLEQPSRAFPSTASAPRISSALVTITARQRAEYEEIDLAGPQPDPSSARESNVTQLNLAVRRKYGYLSMNLYH